MSINYQSQVIGEVRAAQLSAVPGIGVTRLGFSLAWSIHPKRDDNVYTVFGTCIRVSVAPDDSSFDKAIYLGHGEPETAWCGESRKHSHEESLLYFLTLSSDQFLALEMFRQGRGLLFLIEVRGNATGPFGIARVYETLQLRVSLSEWIRLVKEAGATDTLLVGVVLPSAKQTPKLSAAFNFVRRAHEYLLKGEYDSAVGECRRAIESVWKLGKLKEPARSARKALAGAMEERHSMSKRDRLLAFGEALTNFTHPAHHVEQDGDPEIFSRHDAALAVASTAALVSSLAGSVGGRGRSDRTRSSGVDS